MYCFVYRNPYYGFKEKGKVMLYLKEHRKKAGLSVPQLVKATDISRRTIQDIEKRGDCLVSNAKKLAAALGVTLDELCDFTIE